MSVREESARPASPEFEPQDGRPAWRTQQPLRELKARRAPVVRAVDVRGDRLARQLDDEVELEGVEVLLVSRAHTPCEAQEALVSEERSGLRVRLEVEHIPTERLDAARERLEGLAHALQPARQNVVPRDVDPACENAACPCAIRHHVRIGAGAVGLERQRLANVLVLRLVEADVVGVCGVLLQPLDQSTQRLCRAIVEQVALVKGAAAHVWWDVEAAPRLHDEREQDGEDERGCGTDQPMLRHRLFCNLRVELAAQV